MNKLIRRGFELNVESARNNLTDIAGVRVICSYIDDIYLISGMLLSQNDIVLVHTSDYIKNPKPNGYRSLHHIITVPVFLSTKVAARFSDRVRFVFHLSSFDIFCQA